MDIVNYLASNVPLFSICLVMISLSIRNFKIKKVEAFLFLLFTGIVIFLALVVGIEIISQREGLVVLGTIFTSLGYISRPILLYVFILLANMDQTRSKKFYYIFGIPLLINTVIYLFPLFFGVDALAKLVFYYQLNPDGTASFIRGGFLNFSSHIVSGFLLLGLIYVSTLRFYGKHRRDGLVFILCAAIIILTVTTEMLLNRTDLLNIVCEICVLICYIFIISVNASRDPLTHLYDRRTYYEDISHYKDIVNGIIQIDMNELKFLNDNHGHEEGDIALTKIAEVLEQSINRSSMCAYRLSGDEFLVLMYQGKKEDLDATVQSIKERMAKTEYSIAIGSFYYEKADDINYEQAMKKAEELMYEDKSNHYKESGHDRRRSGK